MTVITTNKIKEMKKIDEKEILPRLSFNILELQRYTNEGIRFLAESYGMITEGKSRQVIIYEILDFQQSQIVND